MAKDSRRSVVGRVTKDNRDGSIEYACQDFEGVETADLFAAKVNMDELGIPNLEGAKIRTTDKGGYSIAVPAEKHCPTCRCGAGTLEFY